jgi:hypothetical protein
LLLASEEHTGTRSQDASVRLRSIADAVRADRIACPISHAKTQSAGDVTRRPDVPFRVNALDRCSS